MVAYDPALLFYIFAFLFLLIRYYTDKPALWRGYTACMIIAALLNSISLAHGIFWAPFYAMRTLFILISLALAAVCLIFSFKEGKSYIGLILLPVVIVSGLLAILFAGSSVKSKAMESMWLYLHIPLIVIGMAFFIGAFAAGFMYLILAVHLKKKAPGRMFMRLPSLTSSDVLSDLALCLGFAFYSAGMFAAIAWTVMRFDSLDPQPGTFYIKITASAAVWLIVGAIILIKKLLPATVKRMAFITAAGFAGTSITLAAVVLAMFRI